MQGAPVTAAGEERMNYYIITGASSGIGAAIAESFVETGNTIFCVSRRKNKDLMNMAGDAGVALEYISMDLSRTGKLSGLMERIFRKISREGAERLVLVNNAGVLEPIGPSQHNSADDIHRSVAVNLTAPMVLTSNFIRLGAGYRVPKTVVNLSSGAGKRPIFGWSSYCATKAGLDLYTRTVGLEQEGKEFPVTIYAFAPGVVDTPMQERIRKTAPGMFRDRDRFIAYQEEGNLIDPAHAAGEIKKLILEGGGENGAYPPEI